MIVRTYQTKSRRQNKRQLNDKIDKATRQKNNDKTTKRKRQNETTKTTKRNDKKKSSLRQNVFRPVRITNMGPHENSKYNHVLPLNGFVGRFCRTGMSHGNVARDCRPRNANGKGNGIRAKAAWLASAPTPVLGPCHIVLKRCVNTSWISTPSPTATLLCVAVFSPLLTPILH